MTSFRPGCRNPAGSFVVRVEAVAGGRPEEGIPEMARYLISFNDGAMDHIPAEELPEVGKAAHGVLQEAIDAGVWVFGGGLERQKANIVATDGSVTDGPYPETKEVVGGFVVVDVPIRDEALEWAARFAAACRCAQEVREIMADPEMEEMLRRADRRE